MARRTVIQRDQSLRRLRSARTAMRRCERWNRFSDRETVGLYLEEIREAPGDVALEHALEFGDFARGMNLRQFGKALSGRGFEYIGEASSPLGGVVVMAAIERLCGLVVARFEGGLLVECGLYTSWAALSEQGSPVYTTNDIRSVNYGLPPRKVVLTEMWLRASVAVPAPWTSGLWPAAYFTGKEQAHIRSEGGLTSPFARTWIRERATLFSQKWTDLFDMHNNRTLEEALTMVAARLARPGPTELPGGKA